MSDEALRAEERAFRNDMKKLHAMTDAQTEARAIALKIAAGVIGNMDAEHVERFGTNLITTALAAKDAEMEGWKRTATEYASELHSLRSRLAEARKAHSTILAVLGNVEHRGGGPNAARMYAGMLNDIREIARRVLTGGKNDG